MPEIIVLAHNIRSTHNIGAIFRTSEGFGVQKIFLSGYSPYPTLPQDTRLPHISAKLTSQIHKTALGTEKMIAFEYTEYPPITALKQKGYRIVALEQSSKSIPLSSYDAPDKIALILGEEVSGIEAALLEQADDIVEIPMVGEKESFNVSVAAGIALYELADL